VAAEEITRASLDLSRQLAFVNRALSEQAQAAVSIAGAVDSMRVQADQAARATAEQSRTIKEMSTATNASARDIKLITTANRSQSAAAAHVVDQFAAIRRITERNAEGVRHTRGGNGDLTKQPQVLAGIAANAPVRKSGNGRSR
jgi:hypothetical protein